ncbi:BadF/BadG/BcrA/BcrD ATPase family protein [Paenibacillus filicis]|uniref:BadF/BadG/BcrA/BcrD ATPase family protein n=1 Tax=Paenibacillus filicis TaxID=669464 RepID=A0ABU9DW34_9BACL
MVKLFLGVDGGGTKTDVYVADSAGNELGRCFGGSTNPHAIGFETAASRIGALLLEALALTGAGSSTGPAGTEPVGVCLALSGIDLPAERENMSRAVSGLLRASGIPARMLVTNDAESALMAALGREEGMLAIAGTGSIVFGRTPDGTRYRVGGWGHLLGDGGSGYRLGLDALQAVMRSHDGVDPPTAMTRRLLDSRGWHEISELKTYIYGPEITKQHVAEFARCAIETARDGDPSAMRIITRHAAELAAQALTLAGKDPWFAEGHLGLSGSIFTHSELYEAEFRQRIADALPALKLLKMLKPPSYGAARLAAVRLAQAEPPSHL